MLSEIKAIGSEQVQGRREYPVAGGRVLYVPAGTSAPWRAILGTSEYPDAIIAEAALFAKRAARALEVARTELKRAEAAEKAAVKAREEAGRTTLAAMQRVERLERIAGATE